MTETAQGLLKQLESLNIPFDFISHSPVQTIEDCALPAGILHALMPKNYFLATRNQKRFFLCLARPEAHFCSSDISHQAGSSRLSFGSEDQLRDLLKTFAGAVSPLGLAFDVQNRVELLVDQRLIGVQRLAFHPCDNCATIAVSGADFFERFLPAVHHTYRTVQFHNF